jgi:two-component system nitrate/nitrite response regulator NarL
MRKSPHGFRDPVRVLIVAADNMTAELLTSALSRVRTNFALTTVTGSSQEVIAKLKSRNPQIALIFAELQDGPQAGFKVLQSLRTSRPRTAAIMLLPSSNSDSVVAAFREGARGIFYRSHSLKSLAKCIRVVHQGQVWAGTEDMGHILGALANPAPLQIRDKNGQAILTRREEDIVRLVAEGLKNREIAKNLEVAEHTVRNYMCRIFDKLGVSTRVELTLHAHSQRARGN